MSQYFHLFNPTSSTLDFSTSAITILGSITAVQRVIPYKLPGDFDHPAPCLPALFTPPSALPSSLGSNYQAITASSTVLVHTQVYR